MNPEIALLCSTAATIAFVHTLAGPDHYLPFVALARSRRWPLAKAVSTTVWCGSGHILGSVVLGLFGLYASIQLGVLESLESLRGDLAAWALVLVGLVYTGWGLLRARRQKAHCADHCHHQARGAGALRQGGSSFPAATDDQRSQRQTLVRWAIFLVFVLGPCEPLIPVLMFPAARESLVGTLAVVAVFAMVTLLTMAAVVTFSLWGCQSVRIPGLARFSDAIAGCTICCCGLSLALLGL